MIFKINGANRAESNVQNRLKVRALKYSPSRAFAKKHTLISDQHAISSPTALVTNGSGMSHTLEFFPSFPILTMFYLWEPKIAILLIWLRKSQADFVSVSNKALWRAWVGIQERKSPPWYNKTRQLLAAGSLHSQGLSAVVICELSPEPGEAKNV